MDSYDIFRNGRDFFQPKTPVAALKAYEGGFIPITSFINISNSTKPLGEEPYDIEAIERLLSRKNLELKSNLILMEIFENLIFNRDQEIALFAAESINIIENRYNKKIQAITEKPQEEWEKEDYSNLGIFYYELALLNRKRSAIMDFYLKEALSCLTELDSLRELTDRELNIYIRLLIELGLSAEAAEYLDQEERENKVFASLLLAEVEFSRKNFLRVRNICLELEKDKELLSEKEALTVSYWMGDQWIDG